MSKYDNEKDFYYKIPENCYHTLIILSDWLVSHGTTSGPFDRQQMEFAQWAPCEKKEEIENQRNYMNNLSKRSMTFNEIKYNNVLLEKMSNIFVRIKNKSFSQIVEAICIRLLYIYPIYVISPSFNIIFAIFLKIISPWIKIRIRILISSRIGHLSLNTDSFLRQRQLGIIKRDIKYIFFASKSSNHQLLKMYKRHLFVVENNVIYKLLSNGLWLWEKTNLYEATEIDFKIYKETLPTLAFTSDEESKGIRMLKEIGINSEKDWYVCIFCRDPSYLNTKFPKGDWTYHNFRNANIDTLKLASEYIVSIGGYVVRVGSKVEQPLRVNF